MFRNELHNRPGIIGAVRMVAEAWLGNERDGAPQFGVAPRDDAGVPSFRWKVAQPQSAIIANIDAAKLIAAINK